MAEMLTGINGEIIKWAREYYNMTQSDAALAIGVDIGRYCNWEDGTEFPTYAKLRKISEVFHKPSALFFFPEPPQLPTIKGDLRTLPDEVVDGLSRNVIRQFEKAQAYQLNLRELYGNRPSVLSRRADFPADINELCDYFRLLLAFHHEMCPVLETVAEGFVLVGCAELTTEVPHGIVIIQGQATQEGI